MKQLAQSRQGLVGREDDGPAPQVTVVDDAVEDVGRIGGVALVAELVDHQHVGMNVRFQSLFQLAASGGA